MQIPWRIVLTKCDLLSLELLEICILVLLLDLMQLGLIENIENSFGESNIGGEGPNYTSLVIPVSASTGAGIQKLWSELIIRARETSVPTALSANGQENPATVREHSSAKLMRKKAFFARYDTKKIGKKKGS